MSQRRTVNSDVSASILRHLLSHTGMSQQQLADRFEVSPGFISRVLSGERALTIDHLRLVEEIAGVPMGAFILAAMPPARPKPGHEKLHRLALECLKQCDELGTALRKRQKPATAVS